MSETFGDRLVEAIAQKGSPICVGIDPMFDSFPPALTAGKKQNDPEEVIDAIFDFTTKVLRIVAPLTPVVKFQSAYFEKYLWEGVEAYYSLIQEAKELGLLVIGDVKRGDIGTTAAAYAEAHLAEIDFIESDVLTPDAITVNPMLGMDTIEPFVKAAAGCDKGLFVLVRTSNPGSAEMQDVKLADGRTWSEMVAEKVAAIAESPAMMGSSGWSSIGAVVGATQTQTMQSLRERMPKSIFLLPGYGAQSATAEMTRAAFKNGQGALVSASRSILYAHKDKKYAGLSWEKAVEQSVLDMRDDLAGLQA